ncbi:MAG: glucokinase [Chloroflexi bacterium]|nr:glucokinase [Chloroflexota bacterium]
MLLAGDVGGTKTDLAVISPEIGPRKPIARSRFPSAQYPSLEAVAHEFLDQVRLPIERATFGVAGPVIAGTARITNLPWLMDETHLARALSIPAVTLLNDLVAIAYGVPSLTGDDLYAVNPGGPIPGGALAVLAPGTGLGEAYLTWDGSHYQVHGSEGGHATFAPADELQLGLLRYLMARYDHVSFERVCSGIGLPNLYAYLRDSGHAEEPDWLADRLRSAADPTPIIVTTALDPEADCHLCTATLDLFVSILGGEAGNMALKVLATGGVYLGGGIPPRILPLLSSERFMQAFTHKGRLTELLGDVPIHVILNPEIALFGAACHALESPTV